MRELSELIKGLSDVPMVLLALVFGWFLLKRSGRLSGWPTFFFLTALGALGGTLLHCIVLPDLWLNIGWALLYIVLFELVRHFALLMVAYLTEEERPEYPAVRWIELLVLAATYLLLIFPLFDSIYLFLVFAALEILRLAVCLARYPKKYLSPMILLLIAAVAVLFQAFRDFIPYAVLWEHIMLAVALTYAFLTLALPSLSKNGPPEKGPEGPGDRQ